jgi:hypothetical protein
LLKEISVRGDKNNSLHWRQEIFQAESAFKVAESA